MEIYDTNFWVGSKTSSGYFILRSEIIRRALVEQLKVCDGELKAAKAGLEQALAEDSDLTGPTSQLDTANANFKNQIKHANMHLPKAKPKAKAKSGAGQTTPAWFPG